MFKDLSVNHFDQTKIEELKNDVSKIDTVSNSFYPSVKSDFSYQPKFFRP